MSNDIPQEERKTVYYNVAHIPPLLITLLAAGEYCGIDSEFFGKLIGICIGLLLVISIYHITYILFKNKKLALIAAFLASIHPNLIILSCSGIRDTLYIPMICFAVLSALCAIEKYKWWKWSLYSLFVILGIMSRKEGVEILLVFFLWLTIELIRNYKNLKTELITLSKITGIVLFSFCFFFYLFTTPYQYTFMKTWNPIRVEYMKQIIFKFFNKSIKESLDKSA